MTNAYACRPCSRETRVVQTSPVVSRACASPSIGRWYASRTSSSHRSSGFIALHFLPPRPDMVAGALHTHLERRDAGSRDPRDLLVFEPVTEFEQEGLAVQGIEPIH